MDDSQKGTQINQTQKCDKRKKKKGVKQIKAKRKYSQTTLCTCRPL